MSVKRIGEYRFIQRRQHIRMANKKLAIDIGQDIKNWFLLGFRKGGGQTDKSKGGWKKRRHKTIADTRTNKRRGILIQSGNLRDSIHVKRATMKQIVVASNLPYSEIHNEGGTINQTVTPKQRRYFMAMYKLTGQARFKNYAMSKTLNIKIPQREYIGHSKELERKIEKEISSKFLKYI